VKCPTEIDWEVYDDYLLKAYRPRTARERFSYGKNYADCLLTGNYSNLKVLSDDKRGHVLKALSALSKYLGKYEDFKLSIKQYGLKWTGKNKDDIIIDRLTKVHNADEIFDWIKLVKKERPELTDFMDLISITGMRLVEAVSCYNMIIQLGQEGKLNEYYNQEKMTLEHFHYKEAFIRKTKKVFISFVPHALIEKIIKDDPIPSTNAILKLLQRIGIRCRFGDIREANGSFLTKCLHEPEIDFLQGRVSASVFQQNYFNPSLIADLQTRALQGIAEIQTKIS
jgi:intergrase/recombinase